MVQQRLDIPPSPVPMERFAPRRGAASSACAKYYACAPATTPHRAGLLAYARAVTTIASIVPYCYSYPSSPRSPCCLSWTPQTWPTTRTGYGALCMDARSFYYLSPTKCAKRTVYIVAHDSIRVFPQFHLEEVVVFASCVICLPKLQGI